MAVDGDTRAKKKALEKEFFSRIPKARRINPFYRSIFEFMYQVHLHAVPGTKLLNIYSSNDFAGSREEVYRERFFNECEYDGIDFWEDSFIYNGEKTGHTLPFPDKSFDLIVTTKYILEHISDPQKVMNELHRILKPGGVAFLVSPFVRRQHQAPYDFFRYTEYGIQHLCKKAGFIEVKTDPTNAAMATFANYWYFFERGLNVPWFVERFFDYIHSFIIEPLFYTLDRLDNGYGRDLTQYFLVRATKGK
ncbi:hypothetical protein A2841_00245 [Candidatus Kaiserbacteria bacterium RIFCSPHIGHO2_01_FULL_48_10]|uniref:Methyltransferase type 11 domain-containing protein n=1 Tax=Candidatus Kaiserbacteria bacterium RIFCSPHIGHO2_01_FULL_48_10 TaxID=1798476 RepID=A0A1F6C1N7_9BACT|nr:MAG: hypothetical protein A2841_00245 [Candidatus Kaiserbacteria bacterium RIFCSPHIGHO2_01_FULL_48_10]